MLLCFFCWLSKMLTGNRQKFEFERFCAFLILINLLFSYFKNINKENVDKRWTKTIFYIAKKFWELNYQQLPNSFSNWWCFIQNQKSFCKENNCFYSWLLDYGEFTNHKMLKYSVIELPVKRKSNSDFLCKTSIFFHNFFGKNKWVSQDTHWCSKQRFQNR